MPLNIKRLKEVRDAILEHKSKFEYTQMDGFVPDSVAPHNRRKELANELLETCGTVGCVAGFTCAMYHPKKYINQGADIETAQYYLGLDDDQADWLFYPWAHDSRTIFSSPYTSVMTNSGRYSIKDAIERLEWLIAGKDYKDYPIPQLKGTNRGEH